MTTANNFGRLDLKSGSYSLGITNLAHLVLQIKWKCVCVCVCVYIYSWYIKC